MSGNRQQGGNQSNRGGSTDRGGSRGSSRGGGGGRGGGNNRRGDFFQGGNQFNNQRGRSSDRGGAPGRGDSQYRGGGGGGSIGRSNKPEFYKGGPNKPSEEITKLEDKIVQLQKNNLPLASLSLKEGEGPKGFPNRPGYGSNGTPVSLWANYFDVGKVQNVVLHQYPVSITPAESSSSNRRRRRIFSLLLNHPTLAGLPLATNYADKLISPQSLQVNSPLELKYYEEEEMPEDSSKTFTITIGKDKDSHKDSHQDSHKEPHKEFRLSELIEDLGSIHDTYPDKEEAIQAMNIVLAAVPNTSPNIQPVGQSKHFDLRSSYSDQGLKGGLIAIKGFFHSVRPSTGRLLLNLNVSTAAFYQECPLMTLINGFKDHNRLPNFKTTFSTFQLERFLKGIRVSIGYLQKRGKNVKRVKTIFGIGKNQGVQADPDKLNFSMEKDGDKKENTNVRDYFKKTYNIDANGIVVDVGRSGRSVYIPASLCTVVPGQVTRQKLDPIQTSSMIRIACKKPHENAQQITESGLQLMGITGSGSGENLLSKFNILPSSQLLAVHGRILQTPKLQYAELFNPNFPGGWNLKQTRFIKPWKNSFRLGCFCLREDLDAPSPENFMTSLIKAMKDRGIASPIEMGIRKGALGDTFERTKDIINSKVEGFKKNAGEGAFLIVILPSRDAATYSHIKYCADIKHGINTLCICPKPGRGGKPQLQVDDAYLANITLKINLKLGGVNHELAKPHRLLENTIYFGIDVTHPTGIEGVPDAPSIAGVVANTDVSLGQWPASIRIQKSRQEMVTELKDMVIERFNNWKGEQLPAKVLVYRDGVSESQYQAVLNVELPQLHEALAEVYGKKPPPKISIIIVGKRHHTRFYPVEGANEKQIDRSSNVMAGTVVDRGVTMERGFDFFMVSHAGIQGTCRPAHYAVIYDDNKLGADQLQNLTYNLCYLFGRATRSVSIVPPAYYADILCERGRCYLYDVYHKQGSNNEPFDQNKSPWVSGVHQHLSKTMFYI